MNIEYSFSVRQKVLLVIDFYQFFAGYFISFSKASDGTFHRCLALHFLLSTYAVFRYNRLTP